MVVVVSRLRCSAPCPPDSTLRCDQRHQPNHRAAEQGSEGGGNKALARHLLHESVSLHQENTSESTKDAQEQGRDIICRHDRAEIADVDDEVVAGEHACNQVCHKCRNDDRRKPEDGIGADDQFEGIERTGQRGVEGGCNRTGGAAANEDAQVGPAQFQG
jgi:hypothetical protein